MSHCQNEQYSKRECLEISGIPARMGSKDIERKGSGGCGCNLGPCSHGYV